MGKRFYEPPKMVDYRLWTEVDLFVFLEVDMNIYLEIFGYIGTALVVASMLMTSVAKLRILNICGSVISAIYSLIIGAYPIMIMNTALVTINIAQLIRISILKKKESMEGND